MVRVQAWICCCAALAACASARAGVILTYQNNSGPFFTSQSAPHAALDDIQLSSPDTPSLISGTRLGYFVTPGGPVSFDIRLNFYDTLDPNAVGGAVNQDFVGGVTIPVTNTSPGPHATPIIDLSGLTDGGIQFADGSFAVDVLFYLPGTTTLDTRVTHLFAGSNSTTGPGVGSSGDVYWRDVDSDGVYESYEARTFNGAPFLANMFLEFYQPMPAPEPTSLALLAAAALLARRRPIRRA